MGRCFFESLIEVVEHRLIAIGNPNRFFQLADLLVISLRYVLNSFLHIRLVAIRDLGDPLEPQQLLTHAVQYSFEGISEGMTYIVLICKKLRDSILKLIFQSSRAETIDRHYSTNGAAVIEKSNV